MHRLRRLCHRPEEVGTARADEEELSEADEGVGSVLDQVVVETCDSTLALSLRTTIIRTMKTMRATGVYMRIRSQNGEHKTLRGAPELRMKWKCWSGIGIAIRLRPQILSRRMASMSSRLEATIVSSAIDLPCDNIHRRASGSLPSTA